MFKVFPDCEEQKKRQTEIWDAMAESATPSRDKAMIKIGVAAVLLVAAVTLFVMNLLDEESNLLLVIIDVIVLVACVAVGSGAVFDLTRGARLKRRVEKAAAESVDRYFASPVPAEITYEIGGGKATVTKGGESATYALAGATVIEKEKLLAVDFSDDEYYCFAESEIGAEAFAELQKALLASHESYKALVTGPKGRYVAVDY